MTACETILTLTPSCLTRRRGFTLAELVVSMVVMSILMVGLGSAILIASHALPERNTSTDALLEASDVVDGMVGELNCALAFTERSATAVEFTVADRNGDLAPETIRYAWSGVAGNPLTREYNNGSAVTIAQDVHSFKLAYLLNTIEESSEPTAPTIIIFDDFEAGAANYVLSGPGTPWYLATSDPFQGLQYLEANKTGVNNDAYATRSVDTTGFTDIVLEYSRRRVGLDTRDNFAVDVSSDGGFNWINLESSTGGSANDPGYVGQVFALDSSFNENPSVKIRFTTECGAPSEYGRIDNVKITGIPAGEAEPLYLYYLTAVRITLQVVSDPSASVETAVRVLNTPEVTGP